MPDPFAQFAVQEDPFAAFAVASQSAPVTMGQESYGRPVSDTGEPYQDFGTRLVDATADIAHPTSTTALAAYAIPGGVPSLTNYVRGVLRLTGQAAQEAPTLGTMFGRKIPNPVGMLRSANRITNETIRREGLRYRAPGHIVSTPPPAPAAWDAPEVLSQGTTAPAFEPQAVRMPAPPPRVVPEGVGPTPTKPHLNPQQLAQALRDQYGSEEASRMLYGRSQPGALSRPEAQAAIRRLAPGPSQLPQQAQRAMTQGIQQGTPEEAWQYMQAAPNELARRFLIQLMRGK